MSRYHDQLLNLIDRIYTTVDSPERWPEVVGQIAAEAETPRGLLFTPHHGMDEGGLWHGHNLGTEELAPYIDYYHQTDIWTLRAFALDLPTDVAVNCDRLVAAGELDGSEFYNDYLKHVDIRGCVSVMFGGEPGSFPRVHLSVYRPVGSERFMPEAETLLNTLAPHVHRALDLGFRFAALRKRASDKLEALNRMDCAVAALNQDGSIAFMNRRAERILAAGDGLAIRHECIVADNHQDNEQLWKLLRNTIGARSKGIPAPGGAMAVSRPSGRRSYAITVAPGAGMPLIAGVPAAWALVFIADPAVHAELPAERIARLYGLTAAEAQLAVALATGQTLNEYAEAHALSMHTVRSALKQVFAKTATCRQAELVRLLLTHTAVPADDAGPGPPAYRARARGDPAD